MQKVVRTFSKGPWAGGITLHGRKIKINSEMKLIAIELKYQSWRKKSWNFVTIWKTVENSSKWHKNKISTKKELSGN